MSEARVERTADALSRFRQGVAEDLLTLAVLHNAELDAERIGQLRASGFRGTDAQRRGLPPASR
jgi:hypothetical protein